MGISYTLPEMSSGHITLVCVSSVVTFIVSAWLLSRVFRKAKVARWKAWVPFVNIWKFLNIGGYSGVNIFLGIVGSSLAGLSVGVLNACDKGDSTTVGIATIAVLIATALAVLYLYVVISSAFNIQKKLGKPWPFIFLAFINLGAPLWLWILGLDSSKWSDKKGRPMIK